MNSELRMRQRSFLGALGLSGALACCQEARRESGYIWRPCEQKLERNKAQQRESKLMQPEGYLSVASILSGFGVTVLMFRIQRELDVRERHPDWPNWLARADYLILASIFVSLLLVVLPIVSIEDPGEVVLAFSAGSCAAAVVLLAAYPLAILDHYRIELGAKRKGKRNKGEPGETIIVIVGAAIAVVTALMIILVRLNVLQELG